MSGTNPDQEQDEEMPPAGGSGLPFFAGLPLDISAFPTGMPTSAWVTGGPLITHPGQEERNDPNFTGETKKSKSKQSKKKESKSPIKSENLLSPHYSPTKAMSPQPSTSKQAYSPVKAMSPQPSTSKKAYSKSPTKTKSPSKQATKSPSKQAKPETASPSKHNVLPESTPLTSPRKRGRPRKVLPQPVSPQPSTSKSDRSPLRLGGAASPNISLADAVEAAEVELDRLFKMAQELRKSATAESQPSSSRQSAPVARESSPQPGSSGTQRPASHRFFDAEGLAALTAAVQRARDVDPNQFFEGIRRPTPPPPGSITRTRFFGDTEIAGVVRDRGSHEEHYCWLQAANQIFPDFISEAIQILNMHKGLEFDAKIGKLVNNNRKLRRLYNMEPGEVRALIEIGALPPDITAERLILASDLEYVLIGLIMQGCRPLYGLGNLDQYLSPEERTLLAPYGARCSIFTYVGIDRETQYLYYSPLVGGACLECRDCWRLFRPPDAMRHSHSWRAGGTRNCLNFNIDKWPNILNPDDNASPEENASIADLYTNAKGYPLSPGGEDQIAFFELMEPRRRAARPLPQPVPPMIPRRYNGPPRPDVEPREPDPDDPIELDDDPNP